MKPLLMLMMVIASVGLSDTMHLSTDEGVRKAFERATGNEMDPRWFGIERPKSFPHVVCIGTFAHDRGMMDAGAFVNGKLMTARNGTQRGLEKAGWKNASEQGRLKLANAWVMEVLCAWESVMHHNDGSFADGDNFHEPTAEIKDGKFVITAWIREPVGMQPQHDFNRTQFTINKDGNLAGSEILSTHTH